ncbi:MAG: TolC family protein [Comamonadaceae bacterium]|nr:TolC family protein [Comamonadaceae bacterium]
MSGAYFEALLANDQLELIEAQKISTTTGLDAARKALAGGTGTRTDVDQAQTRLDMVLAQEIEARQHVDFTRRQLQTLIGRAPDTLARLDPARLQTAAILPLSLNDLINDATSGSPDIRSLKSRVEATRLEVAKASAGHYPTLDLVAQISNSQSDSVTNPYAAYYNRSIGVQFTMPIYSGGYVTSAERQAAAQLQNAQAVLDGAVLDLSLKVEREYRNVTEGAPPRSRRLGQATRSAGVALDSTRKSYAAGVRTLLDVLDADQELKTNERNLVQSRYNYITARIRLAALLGNASPVIEEANGWLR